MRGIVGSLVVVIALTGCESGEEASSQAAAPPAATTAAQASGGAEMAKSEKVPTEAELREKLTPQQFDVVCGGGTERAFTGAYWDHHEKGMYRCVACEAPLYPSDTKFDSGTGWPSFWQAVSDGAVRVKRDTSHGMIRDELECARCGGHLGHVFPDGPKPTGMRHCINSASLRFEPGN
jgi:peptide-methionine (R)-S-oxide reductase